MSRALIAAGLFLCMNPGCSPSWKSTYISLSTREWPSRDPRETDVVQESFVGLLKQEEVPECLVLGKSEFRREIFEHRPGTANSPLRKFAASIGADYVRWAEQPVGAVGGGTASLYQGTGSAVSMFQSLSDYIAIYYRRVEDRGRSQRGG